MVTWDCGISCKYAWMKFSWETKKTRGMILWLSFWWHCRGCEGCLSVVKGFIPLETVEAFWGPLWRRDGLSGNRPWVHFPLRKPRVVFSILENQRRVSHMKTKRCICWLHCSGIVLAMACGIFCTSSCIIPVSSWGLPLGLLRWSPWWHQRSRNRMGRLFSFFIFFLFYSSIYILRLLLKCLLICLLIYSCRLRWKPLFCWVFWGSLACWFACWRLCCLFVAQCVDNENGDAHKAPYLGRLWHISSLLKTLLMGSKKGAFCDIWDMFCILKSNACTPLILKMMFFWFFGVFGGGVSPLYRGFLSGL